MEYRIVIIEEGIHKTIQSEYVKKDDKYIYLKSGKYAFSQIIFLQKVQKLAGFPSGEEET